MKLTVSAPCLYCSFRIFSSTSRKAGVDLVARNAPKPWLESPDVLFDLSDFHLLLAVWIVCPEANTVQHDPDGGAQQDDIVKTPDEFSHVRSTTADKQSFGAVLGEKYGQLRLVPKPVVP